MIPRLLLPFALILVSACASEPSDVTRDEYSIARWPNAVCRQAALASASDADEAKLGNEHDAFVRTYVSCVDWNQSHSIDEPFRAPRMTCPRDESDVPSGRVRGVHCNSAR